jgi:DNA topoisomerase I
MASEAEAAPAARRLVRVRPLEDPGLRRIRSGTGFRYTDHRGRSVADRDLTRIRALVIPPAWKDVWIAREARGHIQAVGTDEAGRRQYIYHPAWSIDRDRGKFARALQLAEVIPRARARVTVGLRREALDRERVLATAFRLLDSAAPRVGSARYMKANGSRGLTTLLRRDASVDGSVVTLSFPAKSGKQALIDVDDVQLASVISPRRRGARPHRHGRHEDGSQTRRATRRPGHRRRVGQHPVRRSRQLHRPPGLPGVREGAAARSERRRRDRDPRASHRLGASVG